MITIKEAVDSYNIDYIDKIKYLMHNDSYQIEVDKVIYLFTNILDDVYVDIFDNVNNIIFYYDKNNCKYIRLTKQELGDYYRQLKRNIIKRNLKDYKKIMYTSLKVSGVIDIIDKEYNFKLLDGQLSKKDNKQAPAKKKALKI